MQAKGITTNNSNTTTTKKEKSVSDPHPLNDYPFKSMMWCRFKLFLLLSPYGIFPLPRNA